eukprot:GHVO01021075.1.p1 GENE.GHVO01021075.1~~GHVO01021075.1.p1  ORF type:complete len:115 (-),score=12.87 GHVO01021075.1:58-402(-)
MIDCKAWFGSGSELKELDIMYDDIDVVALARSVCRNAGLLGMPLSFACTDGNAHIYPLLLTHHPHSPTIIHVYTSTHHTPHTTHYDPHTHLSSLYISLLYLSLSLSQVLRMLLG